MIAYSNCVNQCYVNLRESNVNITQSVYWIVYIFPIYNS